MSSAPDGLPGGTARARGPAAESAAGAPAALPSAASLLPQTWYVLNRAAQRLRELVEQALAPLGLRRRHYAALGILATEGPLSQQALSSRIPIDRATVVQIIDDLERLELAERRPEPADRRAYQIALTARGRSVLEDADRRVVAAETEGLSSLSGAERRTLDRLCRRLCGWQGTRART
jgi:DNA-binding MarR family transcriptional regulator